MGNENEWEMVIFIKAMAWFDFWKNDHFSFIFVLIMKSIFKNEIENENENEPKMSQKWLPEQPYYPCHH
jgi:hypothetical protein